MGAATPEVRIDVVDAAYKDKLDELVRKADSIFAGLLAECEVEPEDGATVLWGHTVSDMQTDVEVVDYAVYGVLHKVTEGSLVTTWGAGYFLTLKFDDFATGLTYSDVKVGIIPSEGAGMVALDSDKNCVFKVTDKNAQQVTVESASGSLKTIQKYDLSNLVLKED